MKHFFLSLLTAVLFAGALGGPQAQAQAIKIGYADPEIIITLYAGTLWHRLQDEPRYLALVDMLEQNMARERAWYEEHKDDLQL